MTTPQEATGMSKDRPKTKEEILKGHIWSDWRFGTNVGYDNVLEAMQIYSDQQTSPLQSEIDRLKSELEKAEQVIEFYKERNWPMIHEYESSLTK